MVPALLPDVPENKDAPCNICGKGWPYHEPACAYAQHLSDKLRFEQALREIAATPYRDWHLNAQIARKALRRD